MTGPTSSGKSKLVHRLATPQDLIINCDTQQFYKDIAIGVAKPNAYYLRKLNYAFVSFLDLSESYSCYHFLKDLEPIIKKKSYKKIYFVGGSPLYQDVLQEGITDNLIIKKKIKEKVHLDYNEKGLSFLLKELKEKDIAYYKEVDKKNPRRILRALEVLRSGKKFSTLRKNKKKIDLDIFKITILPPRKTLYNNIDRTINEMLKKGWIAEIKQLIKKKKLKEIALIKAIGYQEIIDFIVKKQISLSELKKKIQQKTKNYAKQQLTWFKKKKNGIIFLPVSKKKDIINFYNNPLDKWILDFYWEQEEFFFHNFKNLKITLKHFFEN